jgi:hypothetical protein
MLTADPLSATADYRRRARRIRASFSHAPLLRQRALVDLARERNTQTQIVRNKVAIRRVAPVSKALPTTVMERDFADCAASRIQPFGFTFSDRVFLLDSAERQGISRFRANMMLAVLEHQAPARRSAPPEVPSKSFAPSLLLILCVEIAVVGVLVMLAAL